MCIVALAWQLFEDKPLVLLSNRDEFLQRPTRALHEWQLPNGQKIIAGQDAQAGGTWLGIDPVHGRWGVILNYREIIKDKPVFATSRGQLILDYLSGDWSPLAFARQIDLPCYDGFNLVIGDRQQAVLLNNKGYGIEVLAKGLYVLSNGQPNTAWFKTEKLRRRVRQELLPLLAGHEDWQTANWKNVAFEILQDSEQAPITQLPDTGLGMETELALSSIFIPANRLDKLLGSRYGTRVSSLLTITHTGFDMQEKNLENDTIIHITHDVNAKSSMKKTAEKSKK